ncbi:MAG: HAMP domain-containing sensor histidine kinase [Aggregatilineales bacterium]
MKEARTVEIDSEKQQTLTAADAALARDLLACKLNLTSIVETSLWHVCANFAATFALISMSGEQTETGMRAFAMHEQHIYPIESRLLKDWLLEQLGQPDQHHASAVMLPDLQADRAWTSFAAQAGLPLSSVAVGIPLFDDEQWIGTLLIGSAQPESLSETLFDKLERFVPPLAYALAAALHSERLSAALESAQRECAALKQAEQMRRDLTAMIYHDLRGPLHNLHMSISGLRRGLARADLTLVQKLMKLAENSTGQLTRMIRSLLDIERFEQGSDVVRRQQAIPLAGIIAEAVDAMRPLAAEAAQTLLAEIDPQLPPLDVDVEIIRRVIDNLLDNAIKHTPAGGQIVVRAEQFGDRIRVSVTDTGPGIPPELSTEIFDKYFRIEHTALTNGIGLGLAFCRLAVEAHQGSIWVENGAKGGANFIFTLPIGAATAP